MDESLKRKYLAEFVYGGIDGIITTFAVISGALGASLNPAVILILGFANLFADGFSMAVSNYLSTKSERSLDNDKRQSDKQPLKTAFATLISFIVIGFIPLLSFVLAAVFPALDSMKYVLSVVFTAFAFIFVGVAKGFVSGKRPVVSALETLLIGGAAAVIAFSVGYILRGLAP